MDESVWQIINWVTTGIVPIGVGGFVFVMRSLRAEMKERDEQNRDFFKDMVIGQSAEIARIQKKVDELAEAFEEVKVDLGRVRAETAQVYTAKADAASAEQRIYNGLRVLRNITNKNNALLVKRIQALACANCAGKEKRSVAKE